MKLGVDFSTGPPSQATLAQWKAAGVKWAGVQYSALLPRHLEVMDGSGIQTDIYVYEYFPLSPFNQTPEERAEAALRMAASHKVKRVWLDAEDPGDQIGPTHWQANIDSMWRCIGLVQADQYEAGIYSSIYRYRERFGDYAGFGAAGIKFWNADYLETALGPAPTALLFRHGAVPGYTTPDIWQWHNTTMFGGHSVDLNIVADALVEDAPMPEPSPPPPQPSEIEALRALNRTAAIIIAGDQDLADSKPEDKDALRWVVAQL